MNQMDINNKTNSGLAGLTVIRLGTKNSSEFILDGVPHEISRGTQLTASSITGEALLETLGGEEVSVLGQKIYDIYHLKSGEIFSVGEKQFVVASSMDVVQQSTVGNRRDRFEKLLNVDLKKELEFDNVVNLSTSRIDSPISNVDPQATRDSSRKRKIYVMGLATAGILVAAILHNLPLESEVQKLNSDMSQTSSQPKSKVQIETHSKDEVKKESKNKPGLEFPVASADLGLGEAEQRQESGKAKNSQSSVLKSYQKRTSNSVTGQESDPVGRNESEPASSKVKKSKKIKKSGKLARTVKKKASKKRRVRQLSKARVRAYQERLDEALLISGYDPEGAAEIVRQVRKKVPKGHPLRKEIRLIRARIK